MNIFKVLLFFIVLLINSLLHAESLTYKESKALLEQNCNECVIIRSDLEKGIAGMEALLANNFEISFEDKLLLADSYNLLAIKYFKSGSNERTQFFEKRDSTYASLGIDVLNRLNQGKTIDEEKKELYKKILMRYVSTLNKEAELNILEKILEFSPNDSEAIFTYGLSLLDQGKDEEGFAKMEEALSFAQYERAFYQGVELIRLYNDKNRYEDAERIVSILEHKNIDQDVSSLRKNLITTNQVMKIETDPKKEPTKPIPVTEIKPEPKVQQPDLKPAPIVKPESIQPSAPEPQDNILWYLLTAIIVALVIVRVLMKRKLLEK